VTGGSAGAHAGTSPGGGENASGGAGGSEPGAPNGGTGAGSAGVAGGGTGGASSYEPVSSAKFDEMPLFEGQPPNFKANAPAESVNAQGSISNVSVPTLRRFPMDASKATGFGYIVFPGGAYTGLDMDTHATRLAERVGPQGIAVFALKYRVGGGSNDAERDALIDAKRAVRMVKRNAGRWGVVVERVGVIGYSAGSHLALNLAGNFDSGNVIAADPVEQQSSRPAFVGSMSTWAFYKPESPFTFPTGVPPVYFCHAEDDALAPIALARTVDMQVRAKAGVTQLDFYKTGGHSTCHPGDPKMEGHDWPNKLLPWVQTALQ
jgi:acetyl esterase/lipase